MRHSLRGLSVSLMLLMGCASASTPRPIASTEPMAIEIVPISFRLWEPVVIDVDGAVHLGVGLFGSLSADGRLTRSDGSVIATLANDGSVRIGEATTPAFRITRDGIPQALPITNGQEGPAAYYMDDASLVIGATNQVVPVAGYRRGASDETLFVASVIVGTREDVWTH